MKLTVVIVTLILMTLVDEGATWGSWRAPRIRYPRISVHRILQKVCKNVCTTECKKQCPSCPPHCTYVCRSVCEWIRGKRSEPQVIITLSNVYKKNTVHSFYLNSCFFEEYV